MKFSIWHLMVVMTMVALWLPLSSWLLAWEALDHPNKPHSTADFIGFYLGSLTAVGFPLAWIGLRRKKGALVA